MWGERAARAGALDATMGVITAPASLLGSDGDAHRIASLPRIREAFAAWEPREVFPYAPVAGTAGFRDGWRRWIGMKAAGDFSRPGPLEAPHAAGGDGRCQRGPGRRSATSSSTPAIRCSCPIAAGTDTTRRSDGERRAGRPRAAPGRRGMGPGRVARRAARRRARARPRGLRGQFPSQSDGILALGGRGRGVRAGSRRRRPKRRALPWWSCATTRTRDTSTPTARARRSSTDSSTATRGSCRSSATA